MQTGVHVVIRWYSLQHKTTEIRISWNSSVGTVTGSRLWDQVGICSSSSRNCLLHPDWFWGPLSPLPGGYWMCFPGVKLITELILVSMLRMYGAVSHFLIHMTWCLFKRNVSYTFNVYQFEYPHTHFHTRYCLRLVFPLLHH